MSWKNEFVSGARGGIPIALGYLPVSFTFGLIAVSGGLPVWVACLISLTNLTSAGQFAGTSLIFAGAGYMEIAMTTLVINLRYMLMSLSLSQKIDRSVSLLERMIFGFAVTDETFVVGSLKPGKLKTPYLMGLISLPILGWNVGTILGACVSSVLPAALQNAFGIALYGMFIALIVPTARDSVNVLTIILMAVGMNCVLIYVPFFSWISSGFRIIISTIFGAGLGAFLFPKEYPNEEADAGTGTGAESIAREEDRPGAESIARAEVRPGTESIDRAEVRPGADCDSTVSEIEMTKMQKKEER